MIVHRSRKNATLNHNLSSPPMEDLAYWLKTVHAMCPSNTQAKADSSVLGGVGAGRGSPELAQPMDVVEFAAGQQLELGEARLLRLAKTLYRLSGRSLTVSESTLSSALPTAPTPNVSLANVPPMSSVPFTRCFEDFFLKDPCA